MGTMKKSGGGPGVPEGTVTLTIRADHAESLLAALTQAVHSASGGGKGKTKKGKK